jgi:hypothetical protein
MGQPRVLFTTTGLRSSRTSRRINSSSRRHLKLNEIKLIYSLYYIST